MGRACSLSMRSTAVTMKILLLLALAAHQINGQEDGSGNGGMDGSGMEGSGSGMGGSGYGMGGSGYGGYGMGGSGYGGDWMSGSGYGGDWMNGGGECCRTKKIWDHWDQDKNGIYDLVMDGDMMNGMGSGDGYGMGSGMGGGYGYGMGSGGYGMNMGY